MSELARYWSVSNAFFNVCIRRIGDRIHASRIIVEAGVDSLPDSTRSYARLSVNVSTWADHILHTAREAGAIVSTAGSVNGEYLVITGSNEI